MVLAWPWNPGSILECTGVNHFKDLVRLLALFEGGIKAAFANSIDPTSEKFKFDSVQQ